MLQVLTSHTSKLPKKVLKNTKNMTPNSCSVRPEKFHPYTYLVFVNFGKLPHYWSQQKVRQMLYKCAKKHVIKYSQDLDKNNIVYSPIQGENHIIKQTN